ncbi:hypothetical protein NEPTK9_001020 [Candidatus Neptunochlamydia vexilliferae]|uniref:Uncharacterized protein n=1 Tax=Candidatus Neptunichlamydia vexilliferae TaxID=1651774 RepID=A0ABS0AZF5_9BACT|nr:hypothetical protein [Candidatus Neptunochlamydia vexilliferae]
MGICQSQRSRFSPIEAASYPGDRSDAEGVKDGDVGTGKNQLLGLFRYHKKTKDSLEGSLLEIYIPPLLQ